ncbi:MAG: preprotein translocase subunit YajC [Paludibacteraceae bacterium]|nr:preprotein translocase subunit YajC [Paludibacteraceae bacterium]
MLTTILLDEATAPQPGGGNWSFLLMMLLIFVVFYFFMIRPQQKRQKEIQKQRDALKAGDKVVTSGGIYGKIKEVKDNYMLIEIAEGVRIKIDKSQIYASAEDAQADTTNSK